MYAAHPRYNALSQVVRFSSVVGSCFGGSVGVPVSRSYRSFRLGFSCLADHQWPPHSGHSFATVGPLIIWDWLRLNWLCHHPTPLSTGRNFCTGKKFSGGKLWHLVGDSGWCWDFEFLERKLIAKTSFNQKWRKNFLTCPCLKIAFWALNNTLGFTPHTSVENIHKLLTVKFLPWSSWEEGSVSAKS